MNGGLSHFNRRFLQVSFTVVPILIAAFLYFLSRQTFLDQLRLLNRIDETILAREQMIATLSDFDRMENREQELLWAGAEAGLASFAFSRGDIAIRLGALNYLGANDSQTAASVTRLRPLVDMRIKEMTDEIGSRQTPPNPGLTKKIYRDIQSILPIKMLLNGISQRQSTLLIERRQASKIRMETREVIATIFLCLSATIVIVSGILLLRIRELQSIITICAWTQRVNFNGKWMRMEEFLWERYRVKVSHGISEEAFEGVMGIVGKNLAVTDNRAEKTKKTGPSRVKPDTTP